MRLDNHVAHRPARLEGLERRYLLAAMQDVALTGPVPEALHLLDAKVPQHATGLYRATNALTRSAADAASAIAAKALAPFNLNLDAVKQALAKAPLESAANAARDALPFALPAPDGSFASFKLVEAPIMEDALAAQFPQIKTYRGIGIDDPSASLRLDITPLGFHAQVLSVNGHYYIDPFFRSDAAGTYASYYKRDALRLDEWGCEIVDPFSREQVEEDPDDPLEVFFADALDETFDPQFITFGTQLRTYRAAVAANGEYTAFHGGTVTAGQSAVVTAMNRVVGVYETELAIRMVLVANNSSVIYTNSATDPYSNGSSALDQNTPNLNNVIGVNNYDIGHVFTTGSGGVAYLGCVGNNSIKGGGTTGLPSPTGDVFFIDYVAHEMGHQFGGNHTFNASSTQRNASTAYEPGSGSTIMAYAGIMGSENLQNNSDPYFHSASMDEIRNFVSNTIPSIGTVSSTGNNAPTVDAGPSYTIPINTPFVLTAINYSDPDGDALTFDWQQRDLGSSITLAGADNGTSPIIRAWSPTTSPSRTVPRMSNLVNNTVAPGEELPTAARSSFKWRVIARDNRAGGGGVSTDDVTLSVVNTGAAFAVTSPNTAVTWGGGSTQTVTWNVAGTTANGINTANVKISLSTDGGFTYPTVLVASTPNDGSEPVVLPVINASTARIKIEAIGNIFFDISNANFSIILANIDGQTFEDRNGNGALDAGEPALNGVRVFLDSNNNGIQDGGEMFADTSGSGNYSFASLAAGTHHVRAVIPPGRVATSAAAVAVNAAGGSVTQNFALFPIEYTGTSSPDAYELRIGTAVPTPYGDNFNRAALSGGGYTYTTSASGDGGASIVSDILTLTNDATAAANANGVVYISTPTSAFGGFSPTLNQNAGLVTWRFNIQQIRSDPSGFGSGNYGAAFILGGSNNIFSGGGAGNGYAVTIGNNGGNDPIRLSRFTGGVGSLTTLTSSGTDATNRYWSVKVTYDSATNQWRLYTRNDGTSAFGDPQNETNLNQVGSTITDATYVATALTHAGALWNFSTSAAQTAKFDNFAVTVDGALGPPNQLQLLIGGNLTYRVDKALVPSLKFNLGNGDDTMTISYADGNPIPAGGVFFDGGTGSNDQLIIVGSSGSDSVTLSNAFTGPTAGNINLNEPSTGALTVESISFNGAAGSDTLALNAGSYTFNSDVGAGAASIALVVNAGTDVVFNASQHLSDLTIDNATVTLAANGARVINTGSLALLGSGKLDLSDNDMIVRAGALGTWNGTNYTGISGLIKQGAAGGTWSGNGLITSQIAALALRGRTTLAVSQASDAINFAAATTALWAGETVSPAAILIKYTYAGDSDLNGVIDGDDYFSIDNGFPSATVYRNGDFDYSGLLDADDYFWLDQNYAFHGPLL